MPQPTPNSNLNAIIILTLKQCLNPLKLWGPYVLTLVVKWVFWYWKCNKYKDAHYPPQHTHTHSCCLLITVGRFSISSKQQKCGAACSFVPLNRTYGDIKQTSLAPGEARRGYHSVTQLSVPNKKMLLHQGACGYIIWPPVSIQGLHGEDWKVYL